MLLIRRRLYSTRIPFDTKPFPFSRFEPCCPDTTAKEAPNGYVPCQHHPIPNALGKKIELKESMTRPADGLRHIVGCVGYDAKEWTTSRCEWLPGIIQSIDRTKEDWLKSNTPLGNFDKQIITTIAEKPADPKKPDILLFPEFKMMPAVDISNNLIDRTSPLYNALDSIWRNPNTPLPNNMQGWQDIKADTMVFVCTHARRDMRCGYLGPPLVEEFNKQAKLMGLEGKLEAWGTSHFGGKFVID